jgi:hypothetical protein
MIKKNGLSLAGGDASEKRQLVTLQKKQLLAEIKQGTLASLLFFEV